ncbi:MAG: OmpA family protein, partial [Acidimicrobiia bacterium]
AESVSPVSSPSTPLDGPNESKRRRRILGLGALAFIVLFAIAAIVMIPWVQDDLTERVSSKLDAAGLTGLSVSFDGQDGTIRCAAGAANGKSAQIKTIAQSVYGVRVAEVEGCGTASPTPTPTTVATTATTAPVTTASPTTAPATTTPATTVAAPTTQPVALLAASVALTPGSPKVTLKGTVATAAQADTLAVAATAAFGEGNVVNELVVSGGPSIPADDGLVLDLTKLMAAMPGRLVDGEAGILKGGTYLRGTYLDDQALAALVSTAGQARVAAGAVVLTPRAVATVDQAAELEKELNAVVNVAPIPFDSSKATLRPEADPILDKVAALALKYAGVSISVDGHTDTTGSAESNLALSQARADAVRDALVSRGVPAAQLSAKGYGETQPLLPDDSEENKAKNRRVVFSVVKQ